ncbi:hypothetical protein M6B38_206400 [Iris pallida]|uniref:Uncharacterized protein n=1 Tax=Iris pallida TaxID=29817 RepID=A0AAX6E6C4_IRIPA|nr:hypothetical protein M6B38_206400 [Iris pallida]
MASSSFSSDLFFSYSARSSPVDRSKFPRSLSLDRSKSPVPIWTTTKLICRRMD